MPIVNVTSLYSFSSEDPAHPATSLLSKTNKKWRCKTPGEKQAYVIFSLDQPVRIVGIDIGNEHSAYITVLVGKKGSTHEQDLKEILLTSSFMTPTESRHSTMPNRVRCFGKDILIAEVAAEKWDLFKVVCVQPYNKHVQYGIAFVKVHAATDEKVNNKPLVPDGFKATTAADAVSSPFARFKMRKDSSDSDTSATLFQRWKQTKNSSDTSDVSVSAAAAIRDSSSPAALSKALSKQTFHKRLQHTSPAAGAERKKRTLHNVDEDEASSEGDKPKRVDRNRDSLLYNDEDDKPNAKWDRNLQRDLAAQQKQQNNSKDGKARTKPTEKFQDFLTDDDGTSSQEAKKRTVDEMRQKPDVSKTSIARKPLAAVKTPTKPSASSTRSPRLTDSKPAAKPIVYKPFNKLLDGVVLVISGIQNPVRGQLRDKALAMGAKYKPDWDDSCTHLICAFKNTPKYNQVLGCGKIIRKDWITCCYEKKMRFPWRRHALDSEESGRSESEDEIQDIKSKPASSSSPPKPIASTSNIRNNVNNGTVASAISSSEDDDDDDDNQNDRYNVKGDYDKSPPPNTILSSGSDTEDEIERVLKKQKTSAAVNSIVAESATNDHGDDDIYGKSTDEDQRPPPIAQASDECSVSPLPEFYKGKTFYLSRNLGSVTEIKLQRFIGVYGGRLIQNAAQADYIVSDKPKALSVDFAGELVRPLWVFECNDMECLLPTKRYKFT